MLHLWKISNKRMTRNTNEASEVAFLNSLLVSLIQIFLQKLAFSSGHTYY